LRTLEHAGPGPCREDWMLLSPLTTSIHAPPPKDIW
jgi:hypothetical protein